MEKQPLVSVRVLTYNSSNYIIETLDSIRRQTYNNIEIVISDDCSKDNTVNICQDWINSNSSRFTNVKLLTVAENTGVCANSKRSLEATTGDWIKGIGGDDLLCPNAIEEYVMFVQEQKCDICAALMSYIDDEGNDLNLKTEELYGNYMKNLQLKYEKQYYLTKQKIIVPGPVLFYSRKLYEITGGPDPKYGTADEWSFLYKTLKAGFRIFPLEKILVKYRIRQNSLTRCENGGMSKSSIASNRFLMKDFILKDRLNNREFLLWWHLYIKYLKWGNVNMRFLNVIDPLWYVDKIRRI